VARPRKTTNAKGDTAWVRERLLDAAENFFARKGYRSTTLRGIGQRVGVSNATVLHHFGNKLGLYRAVLDRLALAVERLVESVADEPEREPLDGLLRFLAGFSAWTHENPNSGAIAFREFRDGTARGSRLDVHLEAEALSRLSDLIRRGQRQGVFRPEVDVETFVVQLVTTVWLGELSSDTLAMILRGDAEAYRKRFRDEALANLLRGLVTEEEQPRVVMPRVEGARGLQ
jgi:AcrR family transcriptional regulator